MCIIPLLLFLTSNDKFRKNSLEIEICSPLLDTIVPKGAQVGCVGRIEYTNIPSKGTCLAYREYHTTCSYTILMLTLSFALLVYVIVVHCGL